MGYIETGVVFPEAGGLFGAVYGLLGWLYGGLGSYFLAILFFVIIVRLIVLPVEFGAKYFQKKHTNKMAELKPELDAAAEAHAGDPIAMNRARSAVMKKAGAGMGGFCLFSLVNLAVMLTVFITVFQGLVGVGQYNVHNQFVQLREAHNEYVYTYLDERHGGDMEALLESETFAARMNYVHTQTTTSFLWIANFWQPDTMWSSQTISWDSFRGSVEWIEGGILEVELYGLEGQARQYRLNELRDEYNAIFGVIDANDRAMNGWFLLVIFAGASTFLSVWINSKFMKKNKPPEDVNKEKEEKVGYSMRTALYNERQPNKKPAIDQAQMGRIMKYVMPVVMVIFAMTMTGALALYITISSLVTTGLAYLQNLAVAKIIKMQDAKKEKQEKEGGADMTIINPHAKYFKRKKG